MEKNKIISSIIEKLSDQREILVTKVTEINFNEMNGEQKRVAMDMQILNIDAQINVRVLDLT